LPAREINLKACAPEIRTRNLPADPGIEPRPSGRPFRQVHTVPQPTEPPRQAYKALMSIDIITSYMPLSSPVGAEAACTAEQTGT